MSAHTPGPWRINRLGYETSYIAHEFVDDKYGAPVCGLWNPGREDQTANASLIAAAPELLEALHDAERVIHDACQATAVYGDQPPQMYLDALSKARAAIAKAEGQ